MPDVPEPEATGAYQPAIPLPDERFAPGALLASRYRVVAPLGKGGMGEVYRADDLTLAQPVALKFLPVHIAQDPDRLARFRKEVAAARRVSHPNVCRVYDIVEHEGQSFLTMEFVDGEDLSSVLKRLGRVPEEKGIEIARQLCSALAAVHDQGLLHRDLKPANVMLDGRGKVRLTDFGLAAAAEDLSQSEVRSGTPLYQAPEQLSGKEVTVRSDIFALGLVLYELFTGKRAFADRKRETPPSKPSSHVGLNPAVEQIILRCLEPEPTNRPKSAVEVLAALPGGDPLAAALAAGETPSPQLVADAGEVGLIRPWVGAALLAAVVLGIVANMQIERYTILARRLPLTESPAEMGRKGRAVLADIGYTAAPGDSFGLYWTHGDWLRGEIDRDPDWQAHLSPDDPAITFVYREAAGRLTALSAGTEWPLQVTATNPPPTEPGMTGVRLTTSGRLVELYAVPLPDTAFRREPLPDGVWRRLFAAAGLDLSRFRPETPTHVAPVACDERLAWVEAGPGSHGRTVRVEAARCGDRPVFFRVTDDRMPNPSPQAEAVSLFSAIVGVVLGLAVLLVTRNVLKGRADTRTLARVCAVLVVGQFVFWFVGGRPTGTNIHAQLTVLVGQVLFSAVLLSLCYLALEPLVRRRWPWRLTGWRRLFDGRLRDPLVGRDILVGMAIGLWSAAVQAALCLGTSVDLALSKSRPTVPTVQSTLTEALTGALLLPLLYLVMAYVLLLVVRRERLAWGGWVLLFTLPVVLASKELPTGTMAPFSASFFVWNAIIAVVLARFGFLATCGLIAASFCVPYVSIPAHWHADQGLVFAGGLVAVCAGCFYTATGGAKLFREGFFGDD